MKLHALSTTVVFLGLSSLLALAGCGDDGGGSTGGSDATSSTGDTGGAGGAGGADAPATPIGTAQLFVVNPTDASLTLHDPNGDTELAVVEPRDGKWAAFPLYDTEGGCLGADSCVVFEIERDDGATAFFIEAEDGDELVALLDETAPTFAASEVGEPSAGNAAMLNSGMPTGFGYVDGDDFVPLFGLDEVPADALVGYDDGEGSYTLVRDGGTPFLEGNRYYVDGNRTDPPSLLVCDISRDAPAAACVDHLLEE